LYISRENYSNVFYENIKKEMEKKLVDPKNFFAMCENFFKRAIVDEGNFFNLLSSFATVKGKTIKKVFFEDLSYIDQISLVKNSDVIVSLQGSGLCNAIFADKESKIIEISHPFDDTKFRSLYNPTSVNVSENYINYIKTGNWYSLLYNDWKSEAVQILDDEKIIKK
jgi:capsular polysaccharide biosynthesis protein